MKNVKLILMMTLLCMTWSFMSFAQQRGIDEKYNFSGSFNRVRGTQSCLFTANQTGNKVVGRINFSDPRVQGNYTGTITNGVVHATITWVSAPDDLKKATFLRLQKFTGRDFPELSLFDNASYKTNNRVRPKIVYALEKKVFGSTSTTAQNNPSSVANSISKAARDIGGYYRIEGMTDATGTKRNLFVNVKNFPDNKDKSKAYGEALIIGEAYGIGSPQGKLFGYETNGDNVTVMFDPIFEQNKKVTMANGRIVNTSGGMSLVAPRLAYRMVKITKEIAEREGNKLNSMVTVRIDYKFIYVNESLAWWRNKSTLNHLSGDVNKLEIYGTGDIKATSETASRTTGIPFLNNLNNRVFDIPSSRPFTKYQRMYYDEQKKLAWGGERAHLLLGFFKFAKDAELPNPDKPGNAIIPVNYKREFVVSKDALSPNTTNRVGIEVSTNLIQKRTSGDVQMGKAVRKIYLHELNDPNKLNIDDKMYNNIYNKDTKNPIGMVEKPYYYIGISRGQISLHYLVMFTIEIIE